MKLLFPTDFSEASKNAFRYALHVAQEMQAEIITLHVYDLPQIDFAEYPIPLTTIYQVTELGNFENYKQHIPVLHEIADSLGLSHIKISNVLECGNLIDTVHRICKTDAIDYVVMATKGTGGLIETFLGSITSKIMHEVQVPVLAIPTQASFHPAKKMLFITRYEKSDQAILEQAQILTAKFNGKVRSLHVGNQAEDQLQQRVWEQNFPAVEFLNLEAHLDVESHILDYLEQEPFDVLVMPVHHRSFLEQLFHQSLSKKLSMHVQIPILAIPTK